MGSMSKFGGAVIGSGLTYMASSGGTVVYIVSREIMHLALGEPVSPIDQCIKEYALYTSLATAVGGASGAYIGEKMWGYAKRIGGFVKSLV